MRIVISSLGSIGDIQPFLSLAEELRRAGHTVLVACSPAYVGWVEQQGYAACAIGPDLDQTQRSIMLAGADGQDADAQGTIIATFMEALPHAFDQLRQVCLDHDLLICCVTLPLGRMLHELTGIPFVSCSLVPPNQVTNNRQYEQQVTLFLNQFRATLGLPPTVLTASEAAISSELALFGISKKLRWTKAPLPAHYHQIGFFLDETDRAPDPALAAFVDDGEPPVVITFGSMVYRDPAAVTRTLVAALEQSGRRGVIQHGWAGLATAQPLPPSIYAAGYVPHRWLFARAACVIHHAGGGTTAATFQAGVPAICVPHAWDQFFWARVAQASHCADAVIPYQQLTADRLAKAIETTLDDSGLRQTAALLGQQMRTERGVQTARELIERFMEQRSAAA